MKHLTLERKVLRCLEDRKQRTLEEVQQKYNSLYPPSFFKKMLGSRVTRAEVEPILKQLVDEGFVSFSVTSYIEGPLPRPVKIFHIRETGLEFLKKSKKK